MFAYLEGSVAVVELDAVIVDVQGIGYRVFTARLDVAVGETRRWHIVEIIREDRHDLYGFLSTDEKVLFETLIGVQGVGPKLGTKIMSAAVADDLRRHILTSNVDFFVGISGVGKKTAQKIILDLKGVLVDPGAGIVHDEVADALAAFGYTKDDIAAVIPHLREKDLALRVKEALKMLGRK